MTNSFKLSLIAATLVAGTLASARAEAQKGRGAGRGQSPPQGTGRLRNAAQGMCLDVAGWAAQGDANVLLWECNDDPDHVWSFTSEGELHSMNGTCLDAAGYRGEQGANVDVFRCEALDDQRWKLVPRGQERSSCATASAASAWTSTGGRARAATRCCSGRATAPPTSSGPSEPYAPRPTYRRPHAVSEPLHPMEEERFRALVAVVRDASFSDSQLTVIQQAVTRNYLRVGQIKNLIDLVRLLGDQAAGAGARRFADRRSRETRSPSMTRSPSAPTRPRPARSYAATASDCGAVAVRQACAGCVRIAGSVVMTGCPGRGGLGKLLN